MKHLTTIALDAALAAGASYADARVVRSRRQDIVVRNNRVGELEEIEDLGIGVRVIAGGAFGFAATGDLGAEAVKKTAARAVQLGRAAASVGGEPVRLATAGVYDDRWVSTFVEHPFTVPLDEKLDLLRRCATAMRKVEAVRVAEGYLSFLAERQWFASSEGSRIDQEIIRSGGGISATAVGAGEMQVRSYPASFHGQHLQMGYEAVRGMHLVENAERVAREAAQLLTAEPCPRGRRDVILMGDQLGLQIHESVGHATELDRVLGMEANFAGTSFVSLDKKNRFVYGSPIVNLIADATAPGGLATLAYDDDGVRGRRFHVVKNGLFTNYHTNRALAHVAGDDRSLGCNRAEGWSHVPIIRISNLSLAPGDWELDDLIRDTEGGILMETNKSWSIDQQRLNFQFGCEMGWEIRGGRKARLLKNPSYQSMTPVFWGSCDAICNNKHWALWGVTNCGKGEPMQTAEMSHGAAPARFRNVEVGIA
ncbi:MAG: TldD/PmbA family protein [Planctomycetes bacterium]|nr:TldD/PmbA family protein [Planctomycetota bacterium]